MKKAEAGEAKEAAGVRDGEAAEVKGGAWVTRASLRGPSVRARRPELAEVGGDVRPRCCRQRCDVACVVGSDVFYLWTFFWSVCGLWCVSAECSTHCLANGQLSRAETHCVMHIVSHTATRGGLYRYRLERFWYGSVWRLEYWLM